MKFLNTILDMVFPAYCISCRNRGEDLCKNCLLGLRIAERESEHWIFPIYDYRDKTIKKAIWLLKYNGKKRLTTIFARVLYDRFIEELADLSLLENFKDPLLVPIPLSPKRQRERGFNQAELIAKKLIELDKNQNFLLENKVLIKTKDIEHQARIKNRTERLKNIVGSFSVKNEERIKNRCIILIDDVTTTGATLKEARRVLRESGAKKIIAFTIAH